MHARAHRGACGRAEGVDRGRGRLPRECGELEDAASPLPAEIEELKSARESEAGHRAALDCEDATTAGDDPEPVAGSQHRRESAPAARLRVQDLDLSDRAVALG